MKEFLEINNLTYIIIYICIGILIAYGAFVSAYNEARNRWLLSPYNFRNYFEFRWMDAIILFACLTIWPIVFLLFVFWFWIQLREEGEFSKLDNSIFNIPFNRDETER